MLITFRGVCEREWASANPDGTRAEFNKYFKSLSEEDLQVCWITTNDDPTNVVSQKFKLQVEAPTVVSNPSIFENILMGFLAFIEEAETQVKTSLSHAFLAPTGCTHDPCFSLSFLCCRHCPHSALSCFLDTTSLLLLLDALGIRPINRFKIPRWNSIIAVCI